MRTGGELAPPRAAASRERRLGSLVSPLVRHALVFTLAAAATYALAYSMSVSAQLTPWLAAAVGLGIVAALLARRILGVLLLATGAFVGLLLHLHIRLASGEAAIHELSVNSQFYGAALAAAVLAYVATVTLLWFLTGRRRRPRRSASAAAEG